MKARWTLSPPQTSRSNPVQCCSTHQKKTRSYVWHDLFVCVTWLDHRCDMPHSYVWHDSFICVKWLIYVCDMTRSYAWHNSYMCVTWLLHMSAMTDLYEWHGSFIWVSWLIHMSDMTHSSWQIDSCSVDISHFSCTTWSKMSFKKMSFDPNDI